jgi:hypothetical protein
MSHRALLAAAGAQGKLYSEDVFSAYTYTGNGSTQTITNGIDLTKGGMVWLQNRSAAASHAVVDTSRVVGRDLYTNAAIAEGTTSDVTGFTSSGYGLGNLSGLSNASGNTYVSWTFRRAPNFFDVVTWTGDGTSNRQIPHALGIAPGMVTAKRRDAAGDWAVWHRSATGDLYLDTTAAQTASFTQITAASATTFSVSGNANILNATYVAYAWAHDPDTVNGIVQCGSFTGPSATVNLGWEPQYILVKRLDTAQDWYVFDTSRGWNTDGTNNKYLLADSSAAESSGGFIFPNATGFSSVFNGTNVYIAIRRGPMRTPTSGASVYNAIARTGTGAAATVTGVGFAPDLAMNKLRGNTTTAYFGDRLRGRATYLSSASSAAELGGAPVADDIVSFDPSGVTLGPSFNSTFNANANAEIDWFFARAPGFFDIVCDTGTGAAHTVAHNLTVAPELVIRKSRSGATQWEVWHSALANTQKLVLNSSAVPVTDATAWNSTSPTAASFTVGTDANVNTSAATYVSYLFASCPGVSKIGSYSGSASDVTVNCGFASGARFVLAKRIDSTGDWVAVDTVRGIVVGADKSLTLNTTATEVTTADIVDPASVGFIAKAGSILNPAAGATMIYLAIA